MQQPPLRFGPGPSDEILGSSPGAHCSMASNSGATKTSTRTWGPGRGRGRLGGEERPFFGVRRLGSLGWVKWFLEHVLSRF